MQKEKIIQVTGGTVTLKELRVKDVRCLMADAGRLKSMELKELFLNRLDEAAGFLQPLMVFNNCTLEDLTFSEIELITNGLKEVNESFLKLTGFIDVIQSFMNNPVENLQEKKPEETTNLTSSTEQPASSLNEDIAA